MLEGRVEETKQNVQLLQQEKEDLMKKFSKGIAVDKLLNKSGVFGGTGYGIQCWPSVGELSAKSKETLNQLRFTKVEWSVD